MADYSIFEAKIVEVAAEADLTDLPPMSARMLVWARAEQTLHYFDGAEFITIGPASE